MKAFQLLRQGGFKQGLQEKSITAMNKQTNFGIFAYLSKDVEFLLEMYKHVFESCFKVVLNHRRRG